MARNSVLPAGLRTTKMRRIWAFAVNRCEARNDYFREPLGATRESMGVRSL
jgi:hypothetical protein